jgi:hypothetical protein
LRDLSKVKIVERVPSEVEASRGTAMKGIDH